MKCDMDCLNCKLPECHGGRDSKAENERRKEYLKEYRKTYYEKNRERCLEYTRKWRAKNRERVNAYHREYYRKNWDHLKEQRDNKKRTAENSGS